MNIYKVLPDLTNERQMRLWYQGIRKQWSAEDINWKKALPNLSKSNFDDLAKAGNALQKVFNADKMNYNILGNLIPHLHTHILPRRGS